ncbi:MAG TPA: hypothetical protein DDW27_01650, partial [Bacteroidales bacterium]|nr:hypothetical protein [Bacteroidales bacterium]
SFDEFYFWGDMLLNDFDDVDKYLADPSAVFRNVRDLKKIDEEFGGLTPEQAEIITRFWTNVNPSKLTREKTGFLNVWSILNELYHAFRNSLRAKNIAYEGMIFRDVAENHIAEISSGLNWEQVHFIGFNALNECEKALMMRLKKEDKGRFYWDYDNSYINGSRINSAGFFLIDNIKVFGNDMPDDWTYDTQLSRPDKNVVRRIISTTSDIAQVKMLPDLIGKLPGLTPDNAHQTAVILADENLLIPVLSSLPENVQDINITMGYPLRQTQVYALIIRILEMQRTARIEGDHLLFSFRDISRVIDDNLISGLLKPSDVTIYQDIRDRKLLWIPSVFFAGSELLSGIFIKPMSPALLSDYLRELLLLISSVDPVINGETEERPAEQRIRDEFIYRILISLNRLDSASAAAGIDLTVTIWTKILERILNLQSVPFSGEPLSGIQVMGILESRTLDFRNIILLSANEGILPSVTASSSFIPFSLREAFGLPSINHQESIFAYHFFRLLHRAGNVTFVYNSGSEGLKSGEMSRFLQQMLYGSGPKPEMADLSFSIRTQHKISETVERSDEHNNILFVRFTGNSGGKIRYISPSAINTWLNCRMKFYYRYVCGLEEKEKITEEIDPAQLGTLLHDTIRNLYADYAGKVLNVTAIDTIAGDRQKIIQTISNAIEVNFKCDNNLIIAGNEMIIRDVLAVFIDRILQRDKMIAPLKIVSLEELFLFSVSIKTASGRISLNTGGKIDRIDSKDGITRIIDYKTGNVADSTASADNLFEEDRDKELDGWLQTLLYCESYLAQNKGVRLLPVIYKLKRAQGKDNSEMLLIKPDIIIDDYDKVRDQFLSNLSVTLGNIFSSEEPFVMTQKSWGKCNYCPYRVLCQR